MRDNKPTDFEELSSISLIHDTNGTWTAIAVAPQPLESITQSGLETVPHSFEFLHEWLERNKAENTTIPVSVAAGGITSEDQASQSPSQSPASRPSRRTPKKRARRSADKRE